MILDADRNSVLHVPAPVLSRAFQELSRGMVGVTNMRKIREVPFPFPYSQYLSFMLITYWLLSPIIASQMVLRPWWAGIIVFVVCTSYFTLFYIAQEIDQPFGEDPNDLPVADMQRDFNKKLSFLHNPLSYSVPGYNFDSIMSINVLDSSLSVIADIEDSDSEKDDVHRVSVPETAESWWEPLEPSVLQTKIQRLLPMQTRELGRLLCTLVEDSSIRATEMNEMNEMNEVTAAASSDTLAMLGPPSPASAPSAASPAGYARSGHVSHGSRSGRNRSHGYGVGGQGALKDWVSLGELSRKLDLHLEKHPESEVKQQLLLLSQALSGSLACEVSRI